MRTRAARTLGLWGPRRNPVVGSPLRASLVAAVVVVFAFGPASARERVLWTIGKLDGSSGELNNQSVNYANPKSDPVYVVGKSQARDWYRFQPGPANGLTGGREHPFKIRFELKDAPKGTYRLKVGMLYETPRLSFLKLSVNGHGGLFYFHPRLDFRAGDWEGTFVPQTSVDTSNIDLPPPGSSRVPTNSCSPPSTSRPPPTALRETLLLARAAWSTTLSSSPRTPRPPSTIGDSRPFTSAG